MSHIAKSIPDHRTDQKWGDLNVFTVVVTVILGPVKPVGWLEGSAVPSFLNYYNYIKSNRRSRWRFVIDAPGWSKKKSEQQARKILQPSPETGFYGWDFSWNNYLPAPCFCTFWCNRNDSVAVTSATGVQHGFRDEMHSCDWPVINVSWIWEGMHHSDLKSLSLQKLFYVDILGR